MESVIKSLERPSVYVVSSTFDLKVSEESGIIQMHQWTTGPVNIFL